MVVDISLSKGLAKSILQEIQEIDESYLEVVRGISHFVPTKRAALISKANDLKAVGEKHFLTQIIANHPKWRWALFNVFLPNLMEGNGPNNREVHYIVLRFKFSKDRPTDAVPPECLLSVTQHAYERLFLRLNVVNASQVKEEIHDAICLSVMLLPCALNLQLRQVVLPTKSGIFICSVDEEAPCLAAKTWISTETLKPRFAEVAKVIREVYSNFGRELGVANLLGALPIYANLHEITVPEELIRSLRPFHWLRDEYSPGLDVEGELWTQARLQESASK